jgi:MSHA biogenesis protein MshI
MATVLTHDTLDYLHCTRGANGKAVVTRCGSVSLDEPAVAAAERAARELHLERYRCVTLLGSDQYQLLLVEAPNVPRAELKTAVRWHVKNMLDYHVDDATIDVLDIPRDPAAGNRAHPMYVVAARNEVIKACIDRYEAAHLPLEVIDIAETSQRNVAALYEEGERGVALFHSGSGQSLLTISQRGELFLARRIEVGIDQLLRGGDVERDEARSRVVLELQRTFDHFERQFRHVRVGKILLGPEPSDSGLAEFLAANLDLPTARARLPEVLHFIAGAVPDSETEWRLFHLFGAALRQESKVL